MRALAIPLQICDGFKLCKKSDIFIVRVWDSGQPLTIIRRIFLKAVDAQIVNLYDIAFSIFLCGALQHKLGADGHGTTKGAYASYGHLPRTNLIRSIRLLALFSEITNRIIDERGWEISRNAADHVVHIVKTIVFS